MSMLACSSKIQSERNMAIVPYARPSRKTKKGWFSAWSGFVKDSKTM